jgi:energy-coupling factor transporter ATP-binding protein EcfA2
VEGALWDDARVSTLVRPLDRTLNVLKVALVPALALALSLSAIVPIFNSSERTSENLVVGLVGPLVAAVYLVLLQTQAVGSRIDKAFAQLRRWVALACNHDFAATHEMGGIACKLTPDVFQAPLFPYGRQKELVEDLSQACGQESTGGYWFVEGKSGSGKTRAALMLVQSLVRDSQLFELGTRCYLYDFSKSKAMKRKLIRSLRSPRHAGAVILVDNFQLVDSNTLKELTDLLLEAPASLQAQLIVFLARPREAWSLSPGADVRLLSEAKAAGRYATLRGPLTEVVAEEVSGVDIHVSELVGSLQSSEYATATQMQLAQAIARTQSVPEDVLDILRLLGVENEETAGEIPPELVSLLGILAALSVHRGSFSRGDVRRAIRAIGRARGVLSAAREVVRLYASFHRLRKIGLVSKLYLDGPSFILHEAVAELCIDRLWGISQFRDALEIVGGRRLREERLGDEPVIAWQLAAEIGDQEAMLEGFEDALAVGANLEMNECLGRASERYDLTGATRLQQAIILDRIGDFVESRQVFADASVVELESTNELAVLLAVSRIEANHFRGYETDLEVLMRHPDRIVNVIGEYWEAHIETHSGHFDSDRLLGHAIEAHELIRDDSPFWQVHSLARMHFDSLRSFYLSGRSDFRSISSPPRREIDKYLRERLPIFKAMNTLYARAHLVGHVLLPRLVLFGERVESEDAALAGLELPEPSVSDLCEAMLSLYRQAKDDFWQYGDREASYLQADVLNAEMIQPEVDLGNENLVKALKEYEHFIVSNEFNSLNSYPHFYFLRWNVLKRHENLLRNSDPTEADAYLSDAQRHLTKIVEFDDVAGNVYGQLRARLLALLLRALTERFDLGEMGELQRQMSAHGYGLESDLLSHLIEREGKIESAELVQIFRFYPFVHQ